MDAVILFEEVQGHNKKPARVSFKILTGIFLVCLTINLLWQKGEINGLTQGLFLGIVIFVLINIFLKVKLITQVRTDGIYVRYAPFQPSFSFYPWQSIEEIYIREYNALLEYGGWGVRVSPLGMAFIASGNTGVQLVLKDGSKVLIGTNQVEEMKMLLKKMGW
ncbi:MAG TPA: DUF6141 family protein [Flavisolibacter sp.]|nr:DUF6141 family protein [Flavisolibacter sp.]